LNVLLALKGSIARRIAVRSLAVTLLAAFIVLIENLHPEYFSKVSAVPFTLLGLSLSIFMSFRNNACYDRWYEARKAWGDVITEIRSIIREIQVIKDVSVRRPVLRDLCGFAHALSATLRREDARKVAQPWLSRMPSEEGANFCDRVLREIGLQCSNASNSGQINEWRYTLLANHLSVISRGDRVRADQGHAAAVPVHLAAAPDHLPVLHPLALRDGRALGLGHPLVHGDRQLHLLRVGCDWQRTGGPFWLRRKRPAAGCAGARD
jgi:predicted membrane chloride channel (bestrophin family)